MRGFWGEGSEGTCFTEMQVLAHHGGALDETDPDALWRAIEGAVASVPLDLDIPSESPEERETYMQRFGMLKESPELVESYLELLQAVWAPVNDMWQQALPLLREAGRHVVAQFEHDQALDVVVPTGCDIYRARVPSLLTDIAAGRVELLFVPCLFFGSSMYLEFSGLVVLGTGVGPVRRRGTSEDGVGGPTPQGGGRPDPPGHPALPRHGPELGGRARHALPSGPAHREHARQGAASRAGWCALSARAAGSG